MSSAHLDLRNLRYLQDCDLQTIEQADFPGRTIGGAVVKTQHSTAVTNPQSGWCLNILN